MNPVSPDPGVEFGSPTDQDMNPGKGVELGSPLNPDMSAYRHDPFELHVQVDSINANQKILKELERIISQSSVYKGE